MTVLWFAGAALWFLFIRVTEIFSTKSSNLFLEDDSSSEVTPYCWFVLGLIFVFSLKDVLKNIHLPGLICLFAEKDYLPCSQLHFRLKIKQCFSLKCSIKELVFILKMTPERFHLSVIGLNVQPLSLLQWWYQWETEGVEELILLIAPCFCQHKHHSVSPWTHTSTQTHTGVETA